MANTIKIKIENSTRHVHLTHDYVKILFGRDGLEQARSLSQTGQFVARQRLELIGPKGSLLNVAVVGPERKQSQVELSKSDAYFLGVPETPLLASGDLMTSSGNVTLKGPNDEISLKTGVIIPIRHIHASVDQAVKAGVKDGDYVSVRTFGPRAITLHNVLIRTSPDMNWTLHLDSDEANAIGHTTDHEGELIIDISTK
jgi:propanediol utilization protein